MQRATEEDEDLRDLKTVIRHGWPLRKEDAPVKVRDYFPFRDELTMQNGLIFKGERLVVPTSLREEMTEKLHSSHIGIQGCLRRARKTLYWPGMNKKVEDYIAKCSTCNSYQSEQAKEPMISHHIPTRPWEKVGMDLFELNNRDFLITVDYYSNYFEVDRLTSKTAKDNQQDESQLRQTRHSRSGIPDSDIHSPHQTLRTLLQFMGSNITLAPLITLNLTGKWKTLSRRQRI